jgi:hypothetical protein
MKSLVNPVRLVSFEFEITIEEPELEKVKEPVTVSAKESILLR